MICRLVLDIPFTRGSVFAWEREAGDPLRRYVVTRNGRAVIRCDIEAEAREEAEDMNREVMREALKPIVLAPITLTGEALRRQAKRDVIDLFGA